MAISIACFLISDINCYTQIKCYFRRTLVVGGEIGRMTPGGGFEGRQYEITTKSFDIRSAQLSQLVNEDVSPLHNLIKSNI